METVIGINGSRVDKIKRYKWNVLDRVGSFEWIDKNDLSIDHDYQREKINASRVTDFAANWSWFECGVLIVAILNDEWFVVDGQHRKLAADRRSDIQKLPCMIFEADKAQSAMSFFRINTHKTNMSGFDKFRALLVAGDETAIGLEKLLGSTGHKAANSNGVKAVNCLMTVWGLFKRDRRLLCDLWPLITDVNQDCQVVDSVIRSIYWAEISARKSKQSLTVNPIRTFLIKSGGLFIASEIKKEIAIVGRGGARIEANALIKLINKQRSVCRNKIDLCD